MAIERFGQMPAHPVHVAGLHANARQLVVRLAAARIEIDRGVKMNGGVATLFVKNGDQYQRAATTVKKEDGTSAVGTALDANSPAVAKLNNGEAYYGDATVFGKTYDAGYEPIKDASGAVIGAYFVGFAK